MIKKMLPEHEQQIEANRYISFFSDKGTEFISKNLKTFLKKMGAAIFPRLDRRTGKKMRDFIILLKTIVLGIIDRSIKTIRSMAYTENKIKTNNSLQESFERAFALHNNRPKEVLRGDSPVDVVSRGFLSKPWQILSGNDIVVFDYKKNKILIDKKISKAVARFPIMSPVSLSLNKLSTKASKREDIFKKNYIVPAFSKEFFYIYEIKRPILSTEPILFKVMDSSKTILEKTFMMHELKNARIFNNEKLKISKRLKNVIIKGKDFVTVTFTRFGKRKFVIPLTAIEYFD